MPAPTYHHARAAWIPTWPAPGGAAESARGDCLHVPGRCCPGRISQGSRAAATGGHNLTGRISSCCASHFAPDPPGPGAPGPDDSPATWAALSD
jgi:hypothetical protein